MTSAKRRAERQAKREEKPPVPAAFLPAPPQPSEPRWLAAVLILALAGLSLTIYGLTLCPTVAGGDSSELTTAAATLGIAHPPGYPLFALLGKLFCFLPWGAVAWRINLFSAVCNALAAVVLLLAMGRWTRDSLAGFAAGALFAFSPLAWRYSLVAEVFALNNLFVCLLLYLAIRFWQERRLRFAYAGAFVFALGLAHHHTLLFVGVPICAWAVWLGRKELLRPMPLLILVALIAAGLLPYLYLPAAAPLERISSWGDPTTINGFLHHFLRRDFGTLQGLPGQASASAMLGRSLHLYAAHLPGELLYLGLPAAAWGLAVRLRAERAAGVAGITLVAYLFYLIVFHALLNLPVERPLYYEVQTRFWLQANAIVFLWLGAGLAELHGRFAHRMNPTRVRVATGAVVALAVALQVGLHFRREDQSRNRLIREFGCSVLEPLPANALLFTRGDLYINTIRYLQECEGVRRDVRVLDLELLQRSWMRRLAAKHYPDVVLPPGEFRKNCRTRTAATYGIPDLFAANLDRLPLFITRVTRHGDLNWDEYEVVPHGLVYRVVRRGTPFDLDAFVSSSGTRFGSLGAHSFGPDIRPGSWEAVVREQYLLSQEARAERLINDGKKRKDYLELLRLAHAIAREAVQLDPAPPLRFKNLGIVCFRLRGQVPGVEEEMISAWHRYLLSNPAGDPEVVTIRKILDDALARRARQAPGQQPREP